MKTLITDNFIKNLPKERKNIILEKVDSFVNELQKNNNEIKNIPNSYSVRKIKGNENIFKFRVDIANRVLFTFASKINYIRDEFKEENALIILDYCNHDNQIKRGRSLNLNVDYNNLDIEEKFEELIDKNYKTYYYNPEKVITRIVDNKTLLKLIKEDDKNAIYYLNEEQEECLQSNLTPLFLFGSAGSGKTAVGVNKIYSLYKEYEINIGYFTYSKLLMNETSKMFEYICSQSGKSNFKSNVNFKYISKYLYSKSNKIKSINYYNFKDWFYDSANRNSKIKKANIDVFDLYKEIRGIIKGVIGINWMPYKEFNLKDYSIEIIEFLKEKGYISIKENYFILNTNVDIIIDNLSYDNRYNKKDILNNLNIIKQNIEIEIVNQKMIDKNTYLSLSSEYSIYDKETRNTIYDVCIKYQEWLSENNLYDENDVTRIVLKNLNNNNLDKYDFILVDEIQDLTEIQIYLMYKSVNNPHNILFSGDFNQTINPTFFNSTRIETLFMNNSYNSFYKKVLYTNYRSCSDIVNLSNKIADLRIEKLYKNKRNDYIEKSIREKTNKPFLLKENEVNKRKLVNMVKDRHYVAIVVTDEDEKDKLKYEYGIENSVFTLSEIKGIEKNYIICFNIISKNKDKWENIFQGISYENHSFYRYYFNMLYVAITRARDYVCFYEDDANLQLYEEIKEYIEKINEFDETLLNFDYISNDDDYFNEGQYLESKEKYEEAIAQYKKSNVGNIIHFIKRCEALILKEKGKCSEAGSKLLKLKEFNLASECFIEEENFNKVIKCYVLADKSYEQILKEFKELGVSPLQVALQKSSKEAWMNDFYLLYEKYIDKQISKNIENISYIKDTLKIINKR
ncbi:MAG: UvrD-helicase domain-containing protein [Romboutsia sp.]|uniref:UvrD-helicase domain-containing protein n=1 Tax=Romboutsia sp. TaxID=1965302 RepID=UPI003F3FB89C